MRLGQHELLIRLASGGAANVFLVRDASQPGKERLLALKILLPALAENEDFLNMFFAEARIASRLQHPNVVTIAGFGQVEGIYCLAMEYVFGASLSQVLRASARAKKPLTVGVLLRIAAQVCDALHYAHELRDENDRSLKLVHRDVTPQNILIGFNGVPKLTDFGIAKATNRGWETQAGIVKGKFSYMSPEQALGKRVDRRSDIFCAGIVLWEALTGRDLFKGSTPLEVLTAIRQHKIRPPSKVVPGLTPIVDPIVMKALKRSPRSRYQTAAEMRDDIESLIQRAGVRIDAQTISHEFADIYGDEIVERAFALRAAMAGKGDPQNLAAVLGGSLLEEKHLPALTGGPNNPDPLSLFIKEAPDVPADGGVASALPARLDRSFSQASVSLAEKTAADASNDLLDEEEEEFPPFELDETRKSHDIELPERFVKSWNQGTSRPVPVDELLDMLSEEDASAGYVPDAFAERFGQELKNNPPDVARTERRWSSKQRSGDWSERSGDWSEASERSRMASSGSDRNLSEKGAPGSLRGIPRAPSLDMEPAAGGGVTGRHLDDLPRAPSLDLDSVRRARGRTPPMSAATVTTAPNAAVVAGARAVSTGDGRSGAVRGPVHPGDPSSSRQQRTFEAAMFEGPARIYVAPWVLVIGAGACVALGMVLGLIASGW